MTRDEIIRELRGGGIDEAVVKAIEERFDLLDQFKKKTSMVVVNMPMDNWKAYCEYLDKKGSE